MADSESKTPFTKAGECLDEITFEFDDGQKLYVSQNFLHYVSTVFKAMFENDFKEKETRIVKLKGKQYDEFLEFLLCLHPDEQKPVDDENVFRVVPLAEEYQAKLIIKKSITTMSELLKSELKSAQNASVKERFRRARTCLKILTTANFFQYDKIVTEACQTIGQFGHAIFTGDVSEKNVYGRYMFYSSESKEEDPLVDCKKLYEGLTEALKITILLERLRRRDDMEMSK